jgi:DNA-binding NarL/FixJ family response regulator
MHDAEVCAGTGPRNYQVLWSMEVEASSVEEAAFRAYKTQKTQNASTAQYRVQCTGEQASEVSLANLAPLELLSDRERQVVKLVAKGTSNAEIAELLGIALRTVKAHLSQVFQKLGVRNRINLIVVLLRAGGIDRDVRPASFQAPQNHVVLG